jgi:regulatory protein
MTELPRDRVALELDGHPWRVVPANAVVRASLRIGEELDRTRLRELRRELRRAEAGGIATRVLARRDATRAELALRLERRGIDAPLRKETLDRLEDSGLVDDGRFAAGRAEQLAERGYGDEANRFDHDQRGAEGEAVRAALERLEPEAERARRLIEKRGGGTRTATFLARRGFGEDAVQLAL